MTAGGNGADVLELRAVRKEFPRADGVGMQTVLDGISLAIRAGEVVALLGRSGCGKSTLLRIMAGLMPPTAGTVTRQGRPLAGPNPGAAMVFQSFALLPWLTVQQNVELGLEARHVPDADRRSRTLQAIELIGLDGFEEAFPRELSGGMRQRVGFARALVVEPELLLMDEPFSALDVLTGAQLRERLSQLWATRALPTRAIVVVTHNIDEAVSLADRIVVLGANPGHIRVELPGLPLEERQRQTAARRRLVDLLYRVMTNPDEDAQALVETGRSQPAPGIRLPLLPDASADNLTGFVRYLAGIGGRSTLETLGLDLQMDPDELMDLVEGGDQLGFVDLQDQVVFLTAEGVAFAGAGTDEARDLFRARAMGQIPLLKRLLQRLRAEPDGSLNGEDILTELESRLTVDEARLQFETAIDWGRYAELFSYDDNRGELHLEPDPPQVRGA